MKTLRRPDYFYGLSSLDVGFVDRTFYVGGFVDFLAGCIVIEAEASLGRATTQDIADAVEAKERLQWGAGKYAGGHQQPMSRVSDVDLRLIADLRAQHGLDFRAVEKKNFEADINLVNVLITSKQLLVSEECVELRRQLREGVYNKTRKDMAKDPLGGHYDGLAALRYFCRTAEPLLRRNPYPEGWRLPNRAETNYKPPPAPSGILPPTPFGDRAAKWLKARKFGWK